jgi:hypothetical protein
MAYPHGAAVCASKVQKVIVSDRDMGEYGSVTCRDYRSSLFSSEIFHRMPAREPSLSLWNHLRWHRCRYTTEVREWEGSDADVESSSQLTWLRRAGTVPQQQGAGQIQPADPTGTVEAALLCGVPGGRVQKGARLKLPT